MLDVDHLLHDSEHHLAGLLCFRKLFDVWNHGTQIEWAKDYAAHDAEDLAARVGIAGIKVRDILDSELCANIEGKGIEKIDQEVNKA